MAHAPCWHTGIAPQTTWRDFRAIVDAKPRREEVNRTLQRFGQRNLAWSKSSHNWTGQEMQAWLERSAQGTVTYGSIAYRCISSLELPPQLRVFLREVMKAATAQKLVFTLDAGIALIHTPHWDTAGWLPWGAVRDRSLFAAKIAKVFFEADYQCARRAAPGRAGVPPHAALVQGRRRVLRHARRVSPIVEFGAQRGTPANGVTLPCPTDASLAA